MVGGQKFGSSWPVPALQCGVGQQLAMGSCGGRKGQLTSSRHLAPSEERHVHVAGRGMFGGDFPSSLLLMHRGDN